MARRRLARNPKERMRTKPRGRTCSRKRRKNSCEESEGHFALLAAMRVVLPAESDPVILEGHEAVIGDGDAMGVAGEITDDMLGSAERWFGIDHPVVVKQGV